MLPFAAFMIWLAAVPTVLTPQDAVRAALTHDPSIAASQADIEAARGLVDETRIPLQNPEVAFSASTDGSKQTVSVVQPFSLRGEAGHRSRSARITLESASAAGDRSRFETAANARRAYVRAVRSRELLAFTQADRVLLARLRTVAEARRAAGEGIDLHVRMARLEEARAAANYLAVEAEVAAAEIELAVLTGEAPGELLHDPLSAAPSEIAAGSPRSDVLSAQKRVEAARASLAREHSAAFPGIGVGLFFENDSGSAIVGPAVSIRLPLWNRNQAAIGAARGNLRLAEAQAASLAARAATEALQSEQRLKAAEASGMAVSPDMRADAEPALKAIEILFNAGETNLSDTLLMRSRVVEGQRAWIEARAALALARIDVALARQSESLLP